MNSRVVSVLSGFFLAMLMIFCLGMLSVHKDWLAWRKTMEMRDIVQSLRATGKILPKWSYFRRSPYAKAARYTVHDPAAVSPGLLAITRLDPGAGRYVIDLIGADGALKHRWPVDLSHVVPGGAVLGFLHGTKVLADGSVLVSFSEATALARLDACGNPLWVRTDATYHHVIQKADDGYWTWKSLGGDSVHNHKLFRFDAETGAELEAIDLVDDVIGKSPENALVAAIPEGFRFNRKAREGDVIDIFHPNDIEPLPAAMAGAFPQFEAGDLLLSLRNIGLIAVLDRKTHDFLWAMYGPWVRQHDPDWQADGTITLFNNNLNRSHSNIVRIDPKTSTAEVLFTGTGLEFYSYILGGHQRLANGNWLIVSSMEGRVIEVTGQGRAVREYSNMVNTEFNAIVPNAEHLAEGFFEQMPTCTR